MKTTEDLTVREAMLLSGYSRAHIYTLVFANRITHRKVNHKGPPGRILIISRQSLLDYLATQEREAVDASV